MALNTSDWGAMRDRAHTVEHATHQYMYVYIIYVRMITDAYKLIISPALCHIQSYHTNNDRIYVYIYIYEHIYVQ